MKDVLTILDSEHDRIRIEIYKHPRFNYWFHLYIDEVVTAPIRRLFLTCHFPFAEILVSFFRLHYPVISTRVIPCYSYCMFRERVW